MIIYNVEETKRDLIKTFKYNGKKVLIFSFILCIYSPLSALLFFYIEHCYDVIEKPLSYRESKFIEICEAKRSVNTSSIDQEKETNISTFLQNIHFICSNDTTSEEEIACDLNTQNFMKWLEFVFTVMFTIGYGNVVTRSDIGKIATMILGIPAITLTTATFVFCGNMFVCLIKLIVILVESKIFKKKVICKFNRKVIILQTLLMHISATMYVIFSRFNLASHLNMLDTIYLSFIAFTTIGFGDIKVNRDQMANSDLFIFLIGVEFFLFLMVFAMVASLITAIVDAYTKERGNKTNSSTDFGTMIYNNGFESSMSSIETVSIIGEANNDTETIKYNGIQPTTSSTLATTNDIVNIEYKKGLQLTNALTEIVSTIETSKEIKIKKYNGLSTEIQSNNTVTRNGSKSPLFTIFVYNRSANSE